MYQVTRLASEPTAIAPDGSDVRVLLDIPGRGGLAHFELGPEEVSVAVRHQTVAEIWYFLSGRGEMWLRASSEEAGEVIEVSAGVCLTIPVGTEFQFRCFGPVALSAIGATMPPWPGSGEAVRVTGHPDWVPTVAPGPA
jgi:mannose-6-phosphate isomerase-like protein (cupin superfamily)